MFHCTVSRCGFFLLLLPFLLRDEISFQFEVSSGHFLIFLVTYAVCGILVPRTGIQEISPEYSMEGLMLKLKLQYFGHLMQRTDSLEIDPDAGKD